jgi:hypothetical protein
MAGFFAALSDCVGIKQIIGVPGALVAILAHAREPLPKSTFDGNFYRESMTL